MAVGRFGRSRRGKEDQQKVEGHRGERDGKGLWVAGHSLVPQLLERFVGIAMGDSHFSEKCGVHRAPVISLVRSSNRPGKKKSSTEAAAVSASGNTQASGASRMPSLAIPPSGADWKKAR